MKIMNVEPRLTNRYADAYSHLDQWGAGIPMKLLGGRYYPPQGIDASEGGVRVLRAIAPRHVPDELVAKSLEDYLSVSNCRHEHDCCGCLSTWAEVKKVKRRTWSVKSHYSYNY